MDYQKRKKGKDKSKDKYNKYGKYTSKSLRIRQATQNAILAKGSSTVKKKD